MRGAPPLIVSEVDRAELEAIAASSSLSYRAVRQAKGLLLAAEGVENEETGRRLGCRPTRCGRGGTLSPLVGWPGWGGGPGPGSRVVAARGAEAEVIRLTFTATPDDTSTHWTTRTLAAKVGISKDSVARIWKDLGVKPWQVDTFKVSNDPHFEEKLVDVVGVYLDPPARAVVFSFDELCEVSHNSSTHNTTA